jgi:spore cortex formation protein SpoVR/YcgB (stage V sporulation)
MQSLFHVLSNLALHYVESRTASLDDEDMHAKAAIDSYVTLLGMPTISMADARQRNDTRGQLNHHGSGHSLETNLEAHRIGNPMAWLDSISQSDEWLIDSE